MENCAEKVRLRREIGLIEATSIMISSVIGSGIYVSPKGVMRHMGSVGGGLLVWFGCGLLTFCASLAYMELSTMFMKSGGEFNFLLKGYGKPPAFIFTWCLSLAIKPSTFALLSLTFSEYALNAGGCKENMETSLKLVAICLVFVVVAINCFSVRWSTKCITVFSIGKAISLSIIIIFGIINLSKGKSEAFKDPFAGTNVNPRDIALAFYQGMWAYDGWNQLTMVTEEIKNPGVIIPRGMFLSLTTITFLYLFTNVSYLSVMTVGELLEAPAVAALFGERCLGAFSAIIPIFVAWSVLGTCIDSCFAASRVAYAASRENLFPPIFSMIHITRMTPAPGVILNGSLAVLMIVFNDIDDLINYLSLLNFLFYGLCSALVLVFRYTKPNMERPFRVFLLFPILSTLCFITLTIVPLVDNPSIQHIMASLFVVAALFVYLPFYHFNLTCGCSRKLTTFLQTLIMVAPSEVDENNETEKRE